MKSDRINIKISPELKRRAERKAREYNISVSELIRQLLEFGYIKSEQAGISPQTLRNAMAIGKIPEAEFEAMIEAAKAPTIKQLTEREKNRKDIIETLTEMANSVENPDAYWKAVHFKGPLEMCIENMKKFSPAWILSGCDNDKEAKITFLLEYIADWNYGWLKAKAKKYDKDSHNQ